METENKAKNYKKFTSDYSGKFGKAAVTADSRVCAALGKEILLKGGNAVDATITVRLSLF